MNAYQKEQLDALRQVQEQLKQIDNDTRESLHKHIQPYLEFRVTLERWLKEHTGSLCSRACFESRTSACCSKDGIITFWADVVINAVSSTTSDLNHLIAAIKSPLRDHKCIYLGNHGCLWKIRPLVCAMFVCDQIQTEIIDPNPAIKGQWQQLGRKAKSFRWPDRPILFDHLEACFMALGCRSPLMYINTSPGLMRIKQRAGRVIPEMGDDACP